jgi:hypothetical protein
MGSLTTHWKRPPMPHPTVRSDLHEPLDAHGNLLAEITFYGTFFFDDLS